HQANRAALVNSRNMESFLGSLGKLMVSSAHLQAGLNRAYLNSLSLFPQIPNFILCADARFGACQQVPICNDQVRLGIVGSFSRDAGGQFACYYVDTNVLEESQVSV